jgi:parallel beta-helix repeat protein
MMIGRTKIQLAVTLFIVATAGAIFSPGARADTIFVSGDVSGVWTAELVIVTGPVHVSTGETLTIMPGVSVLFTSYYTFEVLSDAILHAVGTDSEPINFLPFTQGDKTLGLDFLGASGESILEHCYISDAISAGIHIENSSITIRSSLIENCEAGTGSEGGGAIEVLNNSDALIEGNVIRDNYSAYYGGGIFIDNSSPVVTENTITNNLAGYYNFAAGGGIAVFGNSDPEITFNEITSNSVNPSGLFTVNNGIGGGIYYSGGSDGLISSNYVFNNVVDMEPQTRTYGGGIGIHSASPRLEHNVIANNQAQGNDGGGIYMYSCFSTLINNTIVNNLAGGFGGAIYAEIADVSIVNSILYFNQDNAGTEIYLDNLASVVVSYSDIEGTWPGIGNLDVDPRFRDMFSGDFHLQAQMCGDPNDSPLIDVGSPEYFDSMLDCFRGLGTELSDMGAYGGGTVAPSGIDDMAEIPNKFHVFSNYPNPFNPQTTIAFDLPSEMAVSLHIYDMSGRLVDVLVDEEIADQGRNEVVWRGRDGAGRLLPTGTYFYRLEAGEYTETKKMVLLK